MKLDETDEKTEGDKIYRLPQAAWNKSILY